MASNVSPTISVGCIMERIIAGLYTGTLVQHRDLLDLVEDINEGIVNQRTLLHVGVDLGKADWVEELLARGADPDLKDKCNATALSSAKEMHQRFPEDPDHSQVLKMVKLVHQNNQILTRCLEAFSHRTAVYTTPADGKEDDMASFKSAVYALKQEMMNSASLLSSSLDKLNGQVTSIAEEVTSLKGVIARRECAEAMMKKTQIIYGNGVHRVRRCYGRMYDEDDCTRCILKFLCGEDGVKVLVDCENYHNGRIKEKLVDFDGREHSGSEFRTFADFNEDSVYLGAYIGMEEKYIASALALSLSQLSLKLSFCNGGRPYKQGDAERELEWKMARKRGRIGRVDQLVEEGGRGFT